MLREQIDWPFKDEVIYYNGFFIFAAALKFLMNPAYSSALGFRLAMKVFRVAGAAFNPM